MSRGVGLCMGTVWMFFGGNTMDTFRILILVAAGAYVLYRVGKLLWHGVERHDCKATVQGRFVYPNYRTIITGRYFTHTFVPVYEYVVDGKVYHAEIELQNPDPMAFMGEVEVEYNAADPTICYILNRKGTMMIKEER